MENICFIKNQKPITWSVDEDGMLRCTAAVMCAGVLEYFQGELQEGGASVPEHLQESTCIKLYVPPEELAKAVSLKSLEGKPASLSHQWQVAGSIEAVGNTVGSPTYNDETGLVFSDIMITDPATRDKITSESSSFDKLVDISSGYRNMTEWTPGTTPEGEAYDGIQRDIMYNHLMLLPKGLGRCGESVRIFNVKARAKVVEFTQMKVGNSIIKVANEDVSKLQGVVDEKDDKIENAVDPKEMADTITQVGDLNGQIDTLTQQRDELKGSLEALQEQLDQVINPDNMAQAVNEAIEEQQGGTAILNSYKIEIPEDIKKTFGHSLRAKVVNMVKVANKLPELNEDQSSNEAYVRGSFTALIDATKGTAEKTVTVNGANMVKTKNSAAPTTIHGVTAKDRLSSYYAQPKEAK